MLSSLVCQLDPQELEKLRPMALATAETEQRATEAEEPQVEVMLVGDCDNVTNDDKWMDGL